jgi:formate hydrogenlyase subunit 3/multisubunit Na+/H+ antiporter MnhD subunit
VLPFLLLAGWIAGILHSNPFFAVWYLIDTTANGSRGATGVILAVLFTACAWSIAALVWERARKGGLGRPRRRPRVRRPARAARPPG